MEPPELAKPAYGTPCNGCGLCCMNEICPLGQIVFESAMAPCPALEKDGERYACGLLANPSAYRPIKASVYGAAALSETAAVGIGAGVGCDARLPGEAEPPAEYTKALLRVSRTPKSVTRNIEKLWR